MAYNGPRPILPGRSSRQVNPVTGKVEKHEYSNFELESEGHALDNGPIHNHVPGTGYAPGDTAMTRRFEGLDKDSPMDDPGEGPHQDPNYFHTSPSMHKGVPSSDAMDDAGHLDRDTDYSVFNNYEFHGVPSAQVMDEPGLGHIERDQDDPGVPTGGGATDPLEYHGVGDQPMEDPGHVEPAPGTAYGFEDINEWHGVPSSKAL